MNDRLLRVVPFILLACSNPANPPSAADSGLGDTGAVDMGSGDAAARPAPTDLSSFESNAEGIGVAAMAKDFTKAKAILDSANGTWATLRAVLVKDGAKGDALARVDDALAKLKVDLAAPLAKDAEYHANQISLIVPDFFDLYTFAVPSEALRLDAWFRELQIDGEYADLTKGASSLAAAKASWAKLKPTTAPKAAPRSDLPGATTVVADLDKVLADLDAAFAAKTAPTVVTLAQTGLDLVDVVEAVFK